MLEGGRVPGSGHLHRLKGRPRTAHSVGISASETSSEERRCQSLQNIAEGKERETIAELIRYLYIAKGSAAELKTQLLIASEVGYFSPETYRMLKVKAEHVSAMIGALIKTLKARRPSGP